MNSLDNLECGTMVSVTKLDTDIFPTDFIGTVVRICDRFVLVRDENKDEWGCVPEQIELVP